MMARGGKVLLAKVDVDANQALSARFGVQGIPENILRELGTRASLIHARDTVLRGVVIRGGK